MQLKMMLIGTGTLALATSLALGRVAAAIPATGRRTDSSNLPLGLELLQVPQGSDQAVPIRNSDILQPGSTLQVVGYDVKLKGRKSEAYIWIGFSERTGAHRQFNKYWQTSTCLVIMVKWWPITTAMLTSWTGKTVCIIYLSRSVTER